MDGKSDTTTADGWWERVFEEKERLRFEADCEDGGCFTFACHCRQAAIAQITRETGVSFATEE